MAWRRYQMAGLLAALGILWMGCSKPESNHPKVYPVQGEVFFKGKPASNAVIQFHAANDSPKESLCPHAIVQPDGSFKLTTFATNDGAPAGTYAVTLTWPSPPKPGHDEEGPDRFQNRYADLHKPLRQVQIQAGENKLDRINLP